MMPRDHTSSPYVPPSRTESAAGGRHSLWLWAVLACGLALSFAADGSVMAAVEPLHDSQFTHVVRHSIRWLGIGYVQILFLVLLMVAGALLRNRATAAGAWTLLAFAISGIAANILKVLVHRPRPWVALPPPETWWGYVRIHEFQSFPSGESTTTFAVAVALAAWYRRLAVPLILVAVVVAAARVVVGNHFPSDVWAGAMLGIGVGRAVAGLAGRRGTRPEVRGGDRGA